MAVALGGHAKGEGATVSSQATDVFSAQPAVGSTVAVFIHNQDSRTISSITDNGSGGTNTYNLCVDAGTSWFGDRFRIYKSIIQYTHASFAATVNLSGSTDLVRLSALEITGTDQTESLDDTAFSFNTTAGDGRPGTGADGISSGVLTPTTDGQFIFGVIIRLGSIEAHTPGTGYTELHRWAVSGAEDAGISEYQIQTTAANVEATGTTAGDWDYLAMAASFKPAGGGGGSPAPIFFGRRR